MNFKIISRSISLSGVDGSGKSLMIDLLQENLEINGYKVKIIWARGGYTPIVVFLKAFLRKMAFGRLPASGQSKTRTDLLNVGWVQKIWLFFSILELLFIYCVRGRLYSTFGWIVVFDRYLFDTEIDFKIMFPGVEFQKWITWRLLCYCLPKSHLSVLLKIPFDLSKARCAQKFDPFPEDDQTRLYRCTLYSQIEPTRVSQVDASVPKCDVFKSVINLIYHNL